MKKNFILDSSLLFFLGALSSLSLPPFNFFFINFLTFTSFFIFLFKKTDIKLKNKLSFFYGWIFGFGYFLTNLYWITISLTFDPNFNYLIPIAQILIPAFLALFYGLITFIFYLFSFRKVLSSFFLFSLLFGLVEFIRGNILTGFPWNLIIYSFSESLNFISFISLIGTYSFNLFVISFFTVPAIYVLKKTKKEMIVCLFFLLLPILFYSYGLYFKQQFLNKDLKNNAYTIRVVGSNISLDRFYENKKTELVIEELIELSMPESNKKIFFLWPEGIIPNVYEHELILYQDIFSKNFNKNHLIGLGISSRSINSSDNEYFNSFSIFDSELNLKQSYKKVNLVPFGEFLPLENLLNKVGLKTITNNIGSFTSGNTRNILTFKNELDELKFLPLICYEIIYSGKLTKDFNFDFIFNISEDGWFGQSIGPKQHFAHSIFRAIENGKYVVRSSNNGMAAIINPVGEIEQKIGYGEKGFIDFKESRKANLTFFSIYGNKIFLIIIFLYIFLIFSFNKIEDE